MIGREELAERPGQGEVDALLADPLLDDRGAELDLEIADALLDHVLGGAGAGGDQDGLGPVEPAGPEVGDAIDQVGVRAERPGDLGEPLAVGAVLAAQDQHHVGPPGQLADRLLAVLGGVADVILGRVGDPGELLARRAAITILASSTLSVVCVR